MITSRTYVQMGLGIAISWIIIIPTIGLISGELKEGILAGLLFGIGFLIMGLLLAGINEFFDYLERRNIKTKRKGGKK